MRLQALLSQVGDGKMRAEGTSLISNIGLPKTSLGRERYAAVKLPGEAREIPSQPEQRRKFKATGRDTKKREKGGTKASGEDIVFAFGEDESWDFRREEVPSIEKRPGLVVDEKV